MVVQQPHPAEDSGSNPTPPLQFSRCSLADVTAFVKEHHYTHSHMATNVLYCFRIDVSGVLSGAALFGNMAGNPKASCVMEGHDDPHEYQELCRLVLLDELPKNSESRFIGWCLRWLKKNTSLVALISFADPSRGHSGVIYHATNWVYCGLQKQDRNRLIVDGKDIHPRYLYNLYGTSSVKKLREKGLVVEELPRQPKHRFVFPLREGLVIKKRLFNGQKEETDWTDEIGVST